MPTYSFFYDEAEHSRKINYKTISAANYYDNFVTMIVGWPDDRMIFCSGIPLLKLSMPIEKNIMVKLKVRRYSKNSSSTVLLLSTNRMYSL